MVKKVPLKSQTRLPEPTLVKMDVDTRNYLNNLIRALEEAIDAVYNELQIIKDKQSTTTPTTTP